MISHTQTPDAAGKVGQTRWHFVIEGPLGWVQTIKKEKSETRIAHSKNDRTLGKSVRSWKDQST